MRKYGRPWYHKFRMAAGLIPSSTWASYGTHDGRKVQCKLCSRGVCLTVVHVFSRRLLWQDVFSMWDWYSLSPVVRKDIFMSFFQRPDKARTPVGEGGSSPMDVELAKDFPTLACYLGADTWPDGECRQRSTLIVFYEEGQYKACLSDKDTNMTLWSSSRSFEGIPDAIEARLTEDSPDWRKQRVQRKKS